MNVNSLPGMTGELRCVEKYLSEYMPTEQVDDAAGEIMLEVSASKGKRFRPMLVILSGQCGRKNSDVRESLCKIGALTEMVHMASLIHDDIVDDSPLRRGVPTVQHKFGKDMAVYSGDILLGRVLRILFDEDFSLVGSYLGQTIEDMCRGEINQMNHYFDPETTVEQYMANIYGKTASLFQFACRAGAMIGECGSEQIEALCDYGRHLGYLFQIRDDLLDFVSDPHMEGKPTHMDFREGILTLPVLMALRKRSCHEKIRELIELAHTGELTAEDIRELDLIIRRSGALDETFAEMDVHNAAAKQALRLLPDSQAVNTLNKLLDVLMLKRQVNV